jgi:hypothetical protein
VLLARSYLSTIGPAEEQAQAAVLAAGRNQPVAASVVAQLKDLRRERLEAVLADLDPVLGAMVAMRVRQFIAMEMKSKMSVRVTPDGGMK